MDEKELNEKYEDKWQRTEDDLTGVWSFKRLMQKQKRLKKQD